MPNNRNRDSRLSPGEMIMVTAMLLGMVWAAVAIIKWIAETREGKIFAIWAGGALGILWLVSAVFGPF